MKCKIKLAILVAVSLGIVACSDSGSGNNNLTGSDAGLRAIKGDDVDNNGIRDDVQKAILKRFGNDPDKLAAMNNMAKAMQQTTIAGYLQDGDLINEASYAEGKAVDCLVDTFYVGYGDSSGEKLKFLAIKMFNTKERAQADINYNAALSGRTFKLVDNPCEGVTK